MNIIRCYTPTNDSDVDDKDQFYETLQPIIDKWSAKDIAILMGDPTTKVGMANTGYRDNMGRNGLGECNVNGERFVNRCAFNKMIIGGTISLYKRLHKATWVSLYHTTENQILPHLH